MNEEDSKCIVLPLFKGKLPVPRTILQDNSSNEENEELHNNVLSALSEVCDEVRNDKTITGAYLITVGNDNCATSYAMGSLPLAILHTALCISSKQILDMVEEEQEKG